MRSLVCLLFVGAAAAFSSPPKVPSDGFVREAEKKHARVALLALPTLLAIRGATGENPVTFLSHQPADVQTSFFAAAAAIESASLSRLGPKFSLKSSVRPGDWLGRKAPVSDYWNDLEDAAGRTAMLATSAVMLYFLMIGDTPPS